MLAHRVVGVDWVMAPMPDFMEVTLHSGIDQIFISQNICVPLMMPTGDPEACMHPPLGS